MHPPKNIDIHRQTQTEKETDIGADANVFVNVDTCSNMGGYIDGYIYIAIDRRKQTSAKTYLDICFVNVSVVVRYTGYVVYHML